MLKAFLEIGTDPHLFDGLAVTKETEVCEKYMGKYPVISISLANVDGLTFQEAKQSIAHVLIKETERFHFLLESPALSEYNKRDLKNILNGNLDVHELHFLLYDLTDILHKYYKKQVIVLIDEYDMPLANAQQNGYYSEMRDLMRGMFIAALKGNEHSLFAVLTGCLGIWKEESIFGGFDNYKIFSIADYGYTKYFGFTEDEVRLLLEEYALDKYRSTFKEWYGGYRFGEQELYCPCSVLNYVSDLIASPNAQPKTYRVDAKGSNEIRQLTELTGCVWPCTEIEDLIAGQSIHKRLNMLVTHDEIEKNVANLWSYIYLMGYLTMTDIPSRDIFELIIPNREILEIFIEKIIQCLNSGVVSLAGKNMSGNKRLDVAVELYVEGAASVGNCARIAGLDEEAFVKYLGTKEISIFHFDDEEEFLEEMENA